MCIVVGAHCLAGGTGYSAGGQTVSGWFDSIKRERNELKKKRNLKEEERKKRTGIIERAVKPYSASLALLVESCGQSKRRAHIYSLDTPALETNNFRTVTERVRELFRLKFIPAFN